MATAVDTALAEINESLATIGPEFEGLQDYARLNLQPDTAREVAEAIGDYTRRLNLQRAARDAISALLNDGYPDLAVRTVAESVFDDLSANAASVSAALAKFASNQATAMNLRSGQPVPKP